VTKAKKRGAPKRALNKYYVAHPKMVRDLTATNPAWAHPTLADATEHARALLEKFESMDTYLIVKVVRRVRRQRLPAVVEKSLT